MENNHSRTKGQKRAIHGRPRQPKQLSGNGEFKDKMLLKGEKPRLIDEWQIIPQIWDAIRFEVDHQGEEGLFILTGSAVPTSSEKYITRVQDVSLGLPCALCHYGNRENLQAK